VSQLCQKVNHFTIIQSTNHQVSNNNNNNDNNNNNNNDDIYKQHSLK